MSGPNLTNMHQKFSSMSSMHSLMSQGIHPPGHGFVPKKVKPDKPYGLKFTTRMNRTYRGPGRKYLNYALASFCLALLFFSGSALYVGHRNVSRMIVFRTEVFGPLMCATGIVLIGIATHFVVKARQESNRWRANIRIVADGLYHAGFKNDVYSPEEDTNLKTGTYGPRALREVPKPKKSRGNKSRNRSRDDLTAIGAPLSSIPRAGAPSQGVYYPEQAPPQRLAPSQPQPGYEPHQFRGGYDVEAPLPGVYNPQARYPGHARQFEQDPRGRFIQGDGPGRVDVMGYPPRDGMADSAL